MRLEGFVEGAFQAKSQNNDTGKDKKKNKKNNKWSNNKKNKKGAHPHCLHYKKKIIIHKGAGGDQMSSATIVVN